MEQWSAEHRQAVEEARAQHLTDAETGDPNLAEQNRNLAAQLDELLGNWPGVPEQWSDEHRQAVEALRAQHLTDAETGDPNVAEQNRNLAAQLDELLGNWPQHQAHQDPVQGGGNVAQAALRPGTTPRDRRSGTRRTV